MAYTEAGWDGTFPELDGESMRRSHLEADTQRAIARAIQRASPNPAT